MITDELVAIGIAGVNWEWRFLSKHEGNMTIGTLGHTLAAGTGMALSLPHKNNTTQKGQKVPSTMSKVGACLLTGRPDYI